MSTHGKLTLKCDVAIHHNMWGDKTEALIGSVSTWRDYEIVS